ncbi:MAG: hypothetical protein H8E84_04165 [Flavobacteriales bacterium]|nr:hypothetical protein [Flavobacteriales bacterium]
MKFTKKTLFLCLIVFVGFFSCKKEIDNPYDNLTYPDNSDDPSYLVANHTINGLHDRIFSPLCANSGCHDGTLEPDFRTIESTYNTLVYHPLIKNDPNYPTNHFTYRVLPGDTTKSMLYHRLTVEFGELGQKNIMPLGLDTDEKLYWNQNKQQFLADIRKWINEGAKDMFGNSPSLGNFEPEIKGLVAYADGGSTPLLRNNILLQVPAGTQNITVWYSYDDDVTTVQNLTNNKAKFSTSAYNFNNVSEQSITYTNTPISELGFKNTMLDFYHYITIDVSSYTTDDLLYNRIYIQDEHNTITEIPSDGTDFPIIKRYAFEFN